MSFDHSQQYPTNHLNDDVSTVEHCLCVIKEFRIDRQSFLSITNTAIQQIIATSYTY